MRVKATIVIMILFASFVRCFEVQSKSKSDIDLLLVPPAEVEALEDGYGYLLVNLEVEGVSPSIMLSKIKSGKSLFLQSTESLNRFGKKRQLKFKGMNSGFYIAIVKAGVYQIDEVNTPYFDLPFRLDTKNRLDWRITIEKNKTNYIGKLKIDKLRSEKSVNVNLINRIATDKKSIEEQYIALLKQYPIRSGSGFKDDFLLELDGELQK